MERYAVRKPANNSAWRIEKEPGDGFIRVHLSCLVAVIVIHDIEKQVELVNSETLEIIDYSPEIDKRLKIICFPAFKWYCGGILFDI
ncbi:MAG: hypothetical protein MR364_07635 [Oscillospiraceae bacterium]|nr:hypothetical protein [Oscillospiraceae bacterium]